MKWSIGKKLGLGFGLALAALLLLGFIADRSTRKLAEANDFETNTYKVIIEWGDVQATLSDAESGLVGYRLTGAKTYQDTRDAALKLIDEHLSHVEEASKKISENGQHSIKPILNKAKEWIADFRTIPLAVDKSADAASQMAVVAKSSESLRGLNKQIADFDIELRKLAKDREKDADDIALATEWTIVSVSLVLFVLLIAIAIVLSRGITGSTNRLLESATKIAAGNLKQNELPVTTSDEIGELTVAFNKMLLSIKDMTGQTRAATQNINSATAEILASTQEQAASAAEQAAAVQQTTATVEEINQSGNQVSDRAKQVAVSAEAASATTNVGIQAVQNANKTMDAIREQAEAVAENIVLLSERTQTVGEIVATVNDIAEQSNLLALNAAIEAAAAGEHEIPEPGKVYVAPADRHLRLDGGMLKIDKSDPVSFQRPSGTVLLESMARSLGPRALGVILTGMGDDGARGLLAIREAGGFTIAEDESTCVVFGMPAEAVRLKAVCESQPLQLIAPLILERILAE